MTIDRADLAARLAATSDRDQVRGLIFGAVHDVAVLHGGEALARACDPRGTGTRTPFLLYPAADLLRFCWNLGDRLAGTLGSTDEVFFQIGRQATANVFDSVLGRTFVAFSHDPHTLLDQTPPAYRSLVTWGERSIRWPGERHALIKFTGELLRPAHHRGVFVAALGRLEVRTPSVVARPIDLLSVEYDVTWG